MTHLLGIDIGGTNLRAAVADSDGTVVGRAERSTPAGSDAITEATLGLVDRACADARVDASDTVAAGIGSMGPIDRAAGTLVDPPNAQGIDEPVRLVEPLRDRLGTDAVELHNDATCGAIAERAAGMAENLVYLTLSTGIGAGAVVDGDVLVGAGGNAAEIGHVTVDPRGRLTCGCGGDGHWEAYCGGKNVPRYAAHLRRESGDGIETDLPADASAFTAKAVFDRAGDDDDLADLVVERIGRWNAIGVAAAVQAFAPTRIVLGGAVALENPDAILDPIREGIPRRVSIDPPEIGLTDLGADAVLQGAVMIARRRADRAE
ncbi:ROK family protein [Haloplanus salilacus]|uniref:ROK family protein n=1 Tax=Haloplanus salilacus TaxID=2949994 RepID=UPI0030CB7313